MEELMKGSDDGSDDGGASPAAGADASLLSTDPKVVETAAGSSDGSSSTERVLGGGTMAEGDLAAEAEMSVAAADVGESDAPAVKRRRTISKASSAAAAKDSIAKRRRPQRDRQPRAAKYNPSAPSAGAEAAAARAALAAKKRTAVEAARIAAEALGPPKDGDFAIAYNRSTRRWHATMTVYGKPWLIGGYGSEADAKYVCKPSVAKVLKDAAGAKKSRARNGQLPNRPGNAQGIFMWPRLGRLYQASIRRWSDDQQSAGASIVRLLTESRFSGVAKDSYLSLKQAEGGASAMEAVLAEAAAQPLRAEVAAEAAAAAAAAAQVAAGSSSSSSSAASSSSESSAAPAAAAPASAPALARSRSKSINFTAASALGREQELDEPTFMSFSVLPASVHRTGSSRALEECWTAKMAAEFISAMYDTPDDFQAIRDRLAPLSTMPITVRAVVLYYYSVFKCSRHFKEWDKKQEERQESLRLAHIKIQDAVKAHADAIKEAAAKVAAAKAAKAAKAARAKARAKNGGSKRSRNGGKKDKKGSAKRRKTDDKKSKSKRSEKRSPPMPPQRIKLEQSTSELEIENCANLALMTPPEEGDGEEYCVCRGAGIGFMLGCDKCEEWFHGACVGLDEKSGEHVGMDFECALCCADHSPRLFEADASTQQEEEEGEEAEAAVDTEGGAKAEAKDQPIAEAVEGSASKERDEAKAAASPAPVVSKKEKVAAKTFALASSAIAVPKRSISLGSRRVPMWHKVRQCIVQGEGAPTVSSLATYMKKSPNCTVFTGQRPDPKIHQIAMLRPTAAMFNARPLPGARKLRALRRLNHLIAELSRPAYLVLEESSMDLEPNISTSRADPSIEESPGERIIRIHHMLSPPPLPRAHQKLFAAAQFRQFMAQSAVLTSMEVAIASGGGYGGFGLGSSSSSSGSGSATEESGGGSSGTVESTFPLPAEMRSAVAVATSRVHSQRAVDALRAVQATEGRVPAPASSSASASGSASASASASAAPPSWLRYAVHPVPTSYVPPSSEHLQQYALSNANVVEMMKSSSASYSAASAASFVAAKVKGEATAAAANDDDAVDMDTAGGAAAGAAGAATAGGGVDADAEGGADAGVGAEAGAGSAGASRPRVEATPLAAALAAAAQPVLASAATTSSVLLEVVAPESNES